MSRVSIEEVVRLLVHARALGRVTGGTKAPVLADIRGIDSAGTPEVRKYYSSPEGVRYTAALGILVDSALSRIVANLFFRLQRPPHPPGCSPRSSRRSSGSRRFGPTSMPE